MLHIVLSPLYHVLLLFSVGGREVIPVHFLKDIDIDRHKIQKKALSSFGRPMKFGGRLLMGWQPK